LKEKAGYASFFLIAKRMKSILLRMQFELEAQTAKLKRAVKLLF